MSAMLRVRRLCQGMADHVATAMKPPGRRREHKCESVCSGSMFRANVTNMCVNEDLGRACVKSPFKKALVSETMLRLVQGKGTSRFHLQFSSPAPSILASLLALLNIPTSAG